MRRLKKIAVAPAILEKCSHELADILLYTIQLAAALNISLSQAIQNKLKVNAEKYPA